MPLSMRLGWPSRMALGAMALGTLLAPRVMDAGGCRAFAWCYFFMGFCEGPTFPTTGSMLARWIPDHERSKALSIADTGSSLGSMIAFSLGPVVAAAAGWRATYRIWGYGSLGVTLLWALFASSGPEASGRVSARERAFLRDHGLGAGSGGRDLDDAAVEVKGKRRARGGFPYALFGYASAWATVAAHAAFNFGRYFVYNSLVGFYVDVIGLSPVVAGQQFLAAQIADSLGKFAFAPFVDAEIRKRPKRKTRVKKAVSALSFLVFGACMLGLGAARTPLAATSLLVLSKIASSAHTCGFKTTYIDQTALHAGAFSGVSNTIATAAAALSPLVGARLLDGTRHGWTKMFLLIAAVNAAAAALWVSFASADSLDDKLRVNEPLKPERHRAPSLDADAP